MRIEAFEAFKTPPETPGQLLESYRIDYGILSTRSFKSIQDQEKIQQRYLETSFKLLHKNKNLEADMKAIRGQVDARPCHDPSFAPRVVGQLEATKSALGSIIGPDNNETLVVRKLLGREYKGVVGEVVVCEEFYEPQDGERDPMFTLWAKPHAGISGLEGRVTRRYPKFQAAEQLLFTSTAIENGTLAPADDIKVLNKVK